MSDFVGGSIAQAAGSVLSSMINAHTSSKNTKRAIAAQKEENELAYQRSVEQWERENDYNTPTAQMQRLRDAGLNPNLAYGTPNLASPNSPQYQPVDTSAMAKMPSMLGAGIEGAINGRYLNAVIDNMNADTASKQKDAGLTAAQTEGQLTYNKYAEQIQQGIISEQKSRINLNTSEMEYQDMLSFQSYAYAQEALGNLSRTAVEIDEIKSRIDINKQEENLKKLEAFYYSRQVQSNLDYLASLTGLADANKEMTKEQKAQLAAMSTYNILLKKEEANNEFLRGLNLYFSGEQLDLDLSQSKWRFSNEKQWKDIKNASEVVGNMLLGAGAALGGISSAKKAFRAPMKDAPAYKPNPPKSDMYY